jgi:hypothetical protein
VWNPPQKALVIVHLSSLDSFTDACGDVNGAYLAEQLSFAIEKHDGLVVVTDQGWELLGRNSEPRQWVTEALQRHPHVLWLHHDENVSLAASPWRRPMRRLGKLLAMHGIRCVTLGGVWATEDGSSGCVNETQMRLEEQGFVCHRDDTLCGFDEDHDDEEEEDFPGS